MEVGGGGGDFQTRVCPLGAVGSTVGQGSSSDLEKAQEQQSYPRVA